MFKTIAIIAAVLVLLFVVTVLVLASGKPDTFRVQRQASIQAPPEKIFPRPLHRSQGTDRRFHHGRSRLARGSH